MLEAPVSRSFGATPRLYPRPKYPAFSEVLKVQLKAVLLESALWGTLTCYVLQPLYLECVSYLQKDVGLSDAAVFAVLISLSHTLLYMALNAPFGFLDYWGIWQQRKLYRNGTSLSPSKKLIIETLIGAGVNQFLAFPAVVYYLYPTYLYFGLKPLDMALPSVSEVFLTMVCGHIFNDVTFYLTHRMFHTKALYFLHKQHHSFGGTMGIAAEHANPIESVVANVIPTAGGVLFFGCHNALCVIVWTLVRVQQTCFAHSGYVFNNHILDTLGIAHSEEVIFHDHHHASNQGNFGCLFMDYMFGTMDHFVANGSFEGYMARSDAKKTTGGSDVVPTRVTRSRGKK